MQYVLIFEGMQLDATDKQGQLVAVQVAQNVPTIFI